MASGNGQLTKRTVWCGVLLVVMAASTGAQTSAMPPVHTESGDLAGTQAGGVRVYLGVPFAAAPVGNLRWQPPQPVHRGAALLPANQPGASCTQKENRSRPPWTEEFMVQNETSEDCLFLNLWAPVKSAALPHAVLVYLHGGGFVEGSGSIRSYDGTALAKRGLIVVDINYRLGIFGYFANSALVAESPHASAGNYALMDQIAALQWVQRNIAAFGGDPKRVAVAGQSAGAQSIVELMASPLAKGLFQRAMLNSGPFIGPAAALPSLQKAVAAGDAFTAQHGSSLAVLRALPAGQLGAMTDAPPRRPIVDGWVLPEQPDADLAQPIGSDVPVLAGWNADEGSASPTYGKVSAADFRKDAQTKYGAASERFLQLYPATDEAEASRSQITAARDRTLAVASLWAEARAQHRTSPVFLYYFTRVPPWKAHPEFRAHHTAEVPYFFANLDKVHRDYTAEDRAVSDAASGAWVHFAETGTPGTGWTPAGKVGGPFFELGDTRASRPMLDSTHAAFWRSVLLPGPAAQPR